MHISTKNKIKHFGITHFCPVCRSWIRGFKTYGPLKRKRAQCPVCHSLERHRLIWRYFKNEIGLFKKQRKMLHIAPENCFVRRLRAQENLDYLSIDLMSPLADEKMDVTNLNFESNCFDLVYCSHVLEHIDDDIKAMSELYRVLKKGGEAIVLVPLWDRPTDEDPSVTDADAREKRFGQWDHVRIYGMDIVDRIESVGFKVRVVEYHQTLSAIERFRFGITPVKLFYCSKP